MSGKRESAFSLNVLNLTGRTLYGFSPYGDWYEIPFVQGNAKQGDYEKMVTSQLPLPPQDSDSGNWSVNITSTTSERDQLRTQLSASLQDAYPKLIVTTNFQLLNERTFVPLKIKYATQSAIPLLVLRENKMVHVIVQNFADANMNISLGNDLIYRTQPTAMYFQNTSSTPGIEKLVSQLPANSPSRFSETVNFPVNLLNLLENARSAASSQPGTVASSEAPSFLAGLDLCIRSSTHDVTRFEVSAPGVINLFVTPRTETSPSDRSDARIVSSELIFAKAILAEVFAIPALIVHVYPGIGLIQQQPQSQPVSSLENADISSESINEQN